MKTTKEELKEQSLEVLRLYYDLLIERVTGIPYRKLYDLDHIYDMYLNGDLDDESITLGCLIGIYGCVRNKRYDK